MYEATRYARLVGLKLMLLAASFGALATALPGAGAGEASLADMAWGGMKLLHLIIGTAAAGVSLFFLPQFSGKTLGATVSCGILCALVGTPIGWFILNALSKKYLDLPLPGGGENALAAVLGVAGVYLIPGVQRGAAAFRANPLGIVDWFRGRAAAPLPPEDKGGQP
jgi:hypothetical protein